MHSHFPSLSACLHKIQHKNKMSFCRTTFGVQKDTAVQKALVFLSCALQTSTHPVSGLGSCEQNIPVMVCQTKHPAISAWFHLTYLSENRHFHCNTVWRADRGHILFNLVWAQMEHHMEKIYCMFWKWWPHLSLLLNRLKLLSCNCLLFHIIQSHQTCTCID